jgi:hypothetical protein
MMRAFFFLVAFMAAVLVASPVLATAPTFSQGFETDTSGWITVGSNTVTRQPSGYTNSGGYADAISSASGSYHARLGRGSCGTEPAGGGPTVYCEGPYTRWGGYNSTWNGGYSTQVDIYLDAAYAQANTDSYGGNIVCLTASDPSTDPSCKGTRFDFDSAINDSAGSFLRDFVFNAGTGPDPNSNVSCAGWIVAASTNAFRSGASPYNAGNSPQCIATSGWYTFRHTFSEDAGYLKAVMTITPVGSATPTASWTLSPGDPIGSVGCNRYGWFANQEVQDLAIDSASMTGCGTPPAAPFAITGFHYHACVGATCTASDATSAAYTCTDLLLAGSGCTLGTNEYNAGTARHSYLVHFTVANNSGGPLTSLKMQGGLTTSLLRSKPVYSVFSNTCGGTPKIDTSKKANVVTLSGGSLANGTSCSLVVEIDGAQFGTGAGHDAAITGTWSATANAGATQYAVGPTGRLLVHVY